MKIDSALVKRFREERSWSQEHLATVSGLSLRTIQRVESEGSASLDTRMAIASAFGVAAIELMPKAVAAAPPFPEVPRRLVIANSILWASAILVTAILHGPPFLTTVLLPGLAVTSLLVMRPGRACRSSAKT